MSFGRVLRSEWTKFRTVRGWVIGTVVGAVLMIGFGLLTGEGSHSSYSETPGGPDIIGHPYVPTGPDGTAVTDNFTFVHQPLDGDGSITARVGPRTGHVTSPTIAGNDTVTWLRLTRTGDTITGYSSTDGSTWTKVGSVRLTGLATTVQSGLFVASPHEQNVTQHLGGGGSVTGGQSLLTAVFGNVTRDGGWSSGAWTGDVVGSDSGPQKGGTADFQESGGGVTITGTGDIAPDTGGSGTPIERVLSGAFIMLIVIAVLAVLFVTTEYRRGLIRTTFAASPSRAGVLVAKVVVVGAVTFVVGVIAGAVTVPLSVHLLRANGNYVYPLGWASQVRVIAGTAGVLALSAVFALAVGTLLRRTAGAIAAVVVLIVLPYLLAVAGILPAGPSNWLLRLTPAAGFAIQQSIPAYHQVGTAYWPAFGFFPLAPWAGFAVLCGYAVVAVAFAGYVLRRRDV